MISACSAEHLQAPTSHLRPDESASQAKLGVIKKKTLALATGVSRTTPLADHVTVSATISAMGGTLSIPAAGMTLTIQPGSLAQTTTISVTARKGSLIAYDFKPHGIVFGKPLLFNQELKGTNVNPLTALNLTLGYYADPNLLTVAGGTISESIGGSVSLGSFRSTISHFSGYMVASGRSAMMAPVEDE